MTNLKKGTTREFKGKSLLSFPNDYTVVDIETNVTEWKECEIIEISAVKYRSNQKVDSFSVLIKSKGKIDWFITKLTGITDAMVANGVDIVTALTEFKSFVGNDIILGYNVNFDVNMLYDGLMKYKGEALCNDFVDVLRFAKYALRDDEIENRKQTTVANYFGIDTVGAHRAEKDCLICNAIYQILRKRLEK